MSHPLAGALLKWERAKEHHQAFEDELARFRGPAAWTDERAFRGGQVYGVAGNFDPQSGEYVFRIRIFKTPPLRLGIIVGDIVQNLRSCLDHIAREFVVLNNGCVTRRTQFPVYLDSGEFSKNAKGMLRGMSEQAIAFIYGHQPFNMSHVFSDPARDPLWLLNEVARIDRHRMIHTTAMFFVEGSLTPYRPTVRDITTIGAPTYTVDPTKRLEDGTEILRIPVAVGGPNPYMQVYGNTGFHIIIDTPDVPPMNVMEVEQMGRRVSALWQDALSVFEP